MLIFNLIYMALNKLGQKHIKVFISQTSGDKKIFNFYFTALIKIHITDLGIHSTMVKVNKKCDVFYIFIKVRTNRQETTLTSNPNFKYAIEIAGEPVYVFKIPELLQEEVKKMVSGKLTTLMLSTKKVICKFSGLPFNKKEGVFFTSHILLQILYANSPAKQLLAAYLECEVSSIGDELIDELPQDSPVYVENFIKQ
jgi:hypothetical protein